MELPQLLEEYLTADKYLRSIRSEEGTHKYIKANAVLRKLDEEIETALNNIVEKIKLPDEPEF